MISFLKFEWIKWATKSKFLKPINWKREMEEFGNIAKTDPDAVKEVILESRKAREQVWLRFTR